MSKDEERKTYVRVTELLSPWRDFSNIDPEVLENKRIIGDKVHEAIEMYSQGLPYKELTEREERYMDSYKQWECTRNPIFEQCECRLYDDDLKVTGQLDSIIRFERTGDFYLLDFKTTSSANKTHWAIQLGWYQMLAEKNGIKLNPEAIVLQLNDKEKGAKEYRFVLDERTKYLCMATYDVYMYYNKKETV